MSDVNISVLMINLNNDQTLFASINSLLCQDYNDFELIVVDAGSQDNSIAILNHCLRSSEKLRVIKNEERATPLKINHARSVAFDLAIGRIICFADSDCIYPSNWLDQISKAFRNNDVVAVFGGRYPDEGTGLGTLVRRLEGLRSRKYNETNDRIFNIESHSIYYFAGCNLAIKKEIFSDVALFDSSFTNTSFEDVDLQYRILNQGEAILFKSDLKIQHFHPLTFKGLVRKSVLSGRGYAHLFAKQPRTLFFSKWSPIQILILYLILIPCITYPVILPHQFMLIFIVVLLLITIKSILSKELFRLSILKILAVVFIKILREHIILISFLQTMCWILPRKIVSIMSVITDKFADRVENYKGKTIL